MAHIAGRVGAAGAGGVRFFALDNEPDLWNSTHRDVHPAPLSYDEIWQRTVDYGSAIKAQDPDALVTGPVPWGWCAYFWSALDGCGDGGPDLSGHGGVHYLEWYLQKAHDYETANGVRLVDYLDIHYYPQAGGVALSDDEGVAAVRLRSLKSLYDPGYVDESWIGSCCGAAVDLIPRMKGWIDARYPGTKLAITEYNWGGDTGISSALAQAEALAIFGREGVDLAARWVAPAPGSRVEDAFRFYLDYDGLGSAVAGDSVQAASASVDDVGAYAIAGTGTRLFLLLFNKATAARDAAVTLPGGAALARAALALRRRQRARPGRRIASVERRAFPRAAVAVGHACRHSSRFRRRGARPSVLRLRHEGRGRRRVGRLRRDELLPGRPGHASADGGFPPEGEARGTLRAASGDRIGLRGRAGRSVCRRLDRRPRRSRNHRRLRGQRLLPRRGRHAKRRWPPSF